MKGARPFQAAFAFDGYYATRTSECEVLAKAKRACKGDGVVGVKILNEHEQSTSRCGRGWMGEGDEVEVDGER